MLRLFRRFRTSTARRRPTNPRRARLGGEWLEPRHLLAVNVTNLNNSGAGSLRAAIEAVNTGGVADSIVFANLGAGTIYASSTLPTLAVSGTTFQFSGTTSAITLDGTLAAGAGDGLIIGSGVNSISLSGIVLTIQNFAQNGLSFAGPSTGTTISGMTIRANGFNGIQLAGGDYTGTTIRTVAISDNGRAGIVAAAAATGLTIGGTVAGQGNNILGNGTNGIQLAAGAYTGSTIAGNQIVDNDQNGIATAGGVSALTIGGSTASAANSIAINGANGLLFAAGSYAGTTVAGNSIVLNDAAGISLAPAGGSLTGLAIGGTAVGTGNAISSNKATGVLAAAGTYTGTLLAGNQITSNTTAGISLAPGAGTLSGLAIGGSAAGSANAISANKGVGVLVAPGTYTSTVIAGNQIAGNTSHGISLAAAGGVIASLVIGTTANQISGNSGDGVNVASGTYTSTLIQGAAINANTGAGVRLSPAGGTVASLTVGGSKTSNLGNTITDDGEGIVAEAGTYTGTVVQGTTITGAVTGISLSGAQALTVGGATSDLGNVISSSTTRGIYATGATTGSVISSNTISSSAVTGIVLQDATGLTVGGSGAGNTVTGGQRGIVARGLVGGTTVSGNTVSGTPTGILLVDARSAAAGTPFVVGGNTRTAGTGLGNTVTATTIGFHARGDLVNTIVTGNLFKATAAGGNAATLVNVTNLLFGGFNAGDGNLCTAGLGNGLYAAGPMTNTRVYRNNFTASQYGILLDSAKNMFVGFLNTPTTGNIVQYNQVGLFTIGNCAGTGVMNTTWFNNVRKVINAAQIAISPAP
ncbi:MAG: beta strand repeat-containing protein [Pirellulales bacterium]